MNVKIDFVLLWVDGNDPQWLEQKNEYSPEKVTYSNSNVRYRDWDNLQYWFRGVEKFAPWVNNIFFVTWGHLPTWLNTSHPKLKIVKHTDYIPAEYLPTFNSNVIELNLHRIQDLSEHFVLFNDDMFLIDKVKSSDFFKHGRPCDTYRETKIANIEYFHPMLFNNWAIINKHFDKRKSHLRNFWKIYHWKYKKSNFRTLLLERYPYYTGFRNTHTALSHLKSTFETLWALEGQRLDEACMNRFRTDNDLSHWLMEVWNLCEGNFYPRAAKFGKSFGIYDENEELYNYIKHQRGKTVCMNDTPDITEFDRVQNEIKDAFDVILREKSSFEK